MIRFPAQFENQRVNFVSCGANVGEMDKFVVEMCGGIRYTIS